MSNQENKSYIGVDLDGTLAEYHGGLAITKIGKPIPKMVNRVKMWLKEGKKVKIFTARITPPFQEGENITDGLEAIQNWCKEHIGQVLPITNIKDMYMLEYWDDRAIQVIPNTGMTVEEYTEQVYMPRWD